ncbi:hypothetical protein D3C83_58710 [compost metagenome]
MRGSQLSSTFNATCLPAPRILPIARSTSFSTSGCSGWPGKPAASATSLTPMLITSTPGTAAISPAFSIAAGVSTMTITILSAWFFGQA